jgi:AraC-like DNA-binding protein
MIDHLTILLIGFSIFALTILLGAYWFFLPDMRKSLPGKLACSALIVCLILLQLAHYHHFALNTDLLSYRTYGVLLMLAPPTFYYFARVVILPEPDYPWWHLLHLTPLGISFLVPLAYLPLFAFSVGSLYVGWSVYKVLQLRGQHARFKFELFFFAMFALMAMMALTLGLVLPVLPHPVYYLLYTNAISVAVLLIVAALVFFPQLLGDIRDLAEVAYSNTKLANVDIALKRDALEYAMRSQQLYQNEELNLASLAEEVDLTPHQLSELINTEYNMGFSKFVREHRVRAAKTLLCTDTTSSILAISMMTGFRTQSSFYSAFKDITGMSPGAYRKHYSEKP